MISVHDFEITSIIGYFAVLLVIIVILISSYNEYFGSLKTENKNRNSGSFYAGTYWVNPGVFIPINETSENQTIQKVANRHKNAVKLFWIWIVVVLPFLIFINSNL